MTAGLQPLVLKSLHCFFFIAIFLLLLERDREGEGEGEREKERERETLIGCLLYPPGPGIVSGPGIEPTTRACALTRIKPTALLLQGDAPPLSWRKGLHSPEAGVVTQRSHARPTSPTHSAHSSFSSDISERPAASPAGFPGTWAHWREGTEPPAGEGGNPSTWARFPVGELPTRWSCIRCFLS